MMESWMGEVMEAGWGKCMVESWVGEVVEADRKLGGGNERS